MVFAGNQAEAKTKVKKIRIYIGESKPLPQWNKKSVWTQKGRRYVKVNTKGEIRGLKKGVSTISLKTGKKKIKYKIIVKNFYYSFNFSKVSKITVWDLNNGELRECSAEQCDSLKKQLQNNKFRRLAGEPFRKKVGVFQYKICMYDAQGESVYNINVNSKYINFYGKSSIYRAEKAISLSDLF